MGGVLILSISFMTLVSCDDEDDEIDYASEASISSNDSYFSATSSGGTISFPADGGQVTISVSCGTDWTFTCDADWFTVGSGSNYLTVTAEQNTEEQDLSGTIIFKTVDKGTQFATVSVTQNAYGTPEISVGVSEWHAPAKGELSIEITVECSLDDYTVEASESWLTVEKTAEGISVVAAENEETEERNASVTVTADNGVRSASATVEVTQDAKAYVTFSEETLSFYADESSSTVEVTSNYDWTLVEPTDDWFTVESDGEVLTVSVSENTSGSDREGIVTVTAGDGAENVVEAQFTISQSGEYTPALVMVYTTTGDNTEIIFPFDGTVNCNVDWGDNESEKVTTAHPTHTYATAGDYTVTVRGTMTALNNYNTAANAAYSTLVTEVESWGLTGLTSMEYAFYDCQDLLSVPSDTDGSFSNVTTMKYAFYRVQNKSGNTYKAYPSDLLKYCTEVTDFSYAFYQNMRMSGYVIPDGFLDNCVKAVTFEYAFAQCGLNSIPDGLFKNCVAAEDFTRALSGNNQVKSIPEDLFENCVNAKCFNHTFFSIEDCREIPEGLFKDCSKAEDFSYCFGDIYSTSSIPENLFAYCPEATNFEATFESCDSALKSLPAGLFSNNKKVTNFKNCFSYSEDDLLSGESPYDILEINGESVKVHIYERDKYPDVYATPTEYSGCFHGRYGLSDYNDIPSSWGGGGE